MERATNYLFVSGSDSRLAYQLNDNGLLGVFRDSLSEPADEAVISYEEAKRVLSKPLAKNKLWARCDSLFARIKKRSEKSVPAMTVSQQIEISNIIDAVKSSI